VYSVVLQKELFMQTTIASAVDHIATFIDYIGSQNILPLPIIGTRMMSGDESVCVDIAARADSRFQAALILKLYMAHPCYFLLFSLLTGWARSCGLVRGAKEGEDGVMNTVEFHALIRHTLNVLAMNQNESHQRKGYTFNNDKRTLLEAGADCVLTKPLRATQLDAILA